MVLHSSGPRVGSGRPASALRVTCPVSTSSAGCGAALQAYQPLLLAGGAHRHGRAFCGHLLGHQRARNLHPQLPSRARDRHRHHQGLHGYGPRCWPAPACRLWHRLALCPRLPGGDVQMARWPGRSGCGVVRMVWSGRRQYSSSRKRWPAGSHGMWVPCTCLVLQCGAPSAGLLEITSRQQQKS